MKKIGTACLTLLVLLSSCRTVAVTKIKATDVGIDYRLSIAEHADAENHFNWTAGHEAPVHDTFDAASGASAKGSTTAFNAVRYAAPASEKKAAIPAGLRALFLFAVVDWETMQKHALHIAKDDGAITVRFIRKSSAYELTTDKKGNFDPLSGSKCAKNIAEKTEDGYRIRAEYVKDGGDAANMSDLDWEKIDLEADVFNPEAAYHYEGNLKFAFEDDVLTVAGVMNRK